MAFYAETLATITVLLSVVAYARHTDRSEISERAHFAKNLKTTTHRRNFWKCLTTCLFKQSVYLFVDLSNRLSSWTTSLFVDLPVYLRADLLYCSAISLSNSSHLYVYLSVCLFVCLPTCLFLYVSVIIYPPTFIHVYLPICVHLFTCLPTFVYLPINLPACLSIYLPTYLSKSVYSTSTDLTICLSLCWPYHLSPQRPALLFLHWSSHPENRTLLMLMAVCMRNVSRGSRFPSRVLDVSALRPFSEVLWAIIPFFFLGYAASFPSSSSFSSS